MGTEPGGAAFRPKDTGVENQESMESLRISWVQSGGSSMVLDLRRQRIVSFVGIASVRERKRSKKANNILRAL